MQPQLMTIKTDHSRNVVELRGVSHPGISLVWKGSERHVEISPVVGISVPFLVGVFSLFPLHLVVQASACAP